jgi:hypothetical protein
MLVVRYVGSQVVSNWSGYVEVISYLNGVGLSRHSRVTST